MTYSESMSDSAGSGSRPNGSRGLSAEYPILEFDPSRAAVIQPSKTIQQADVPEPCVICFFREVIDKVLSEHQPGILAEFHREDGSHFVYEISYRDQRLAFFHPGVGAPMAAGMLEKAIALGCRKFIACGGAGVLEKDIEVGSLFVVSAAVRDEGVSYHYVPPAREIGADERVVRSLAGLLEKRGMPYRVAKTWTTDAPYRETRAKVALRKKEGCLTVEMESAGLLAVARFREVLFGQVLYGGDDVSGAEWDTRAGAAREAIRENLFWLCAEACLSL
jgi:uridine phosphorylase